MGGEKMQELFSCVGGGVDVVLLFWSWDPEAVRERERDRESGT
jgi:hypothetical protein